MTHLIVTFLPADDGKAEVCDFEDLVREEDVGGLDVAVDDILGGEVLEALVYLANNRPDFFLGQRAALLESFLQIAALAELSDEVAVVGALEDLGAADDVGVVQRPDDRNLLLQQLLQLLEGE